MGAIGEAFMSHVVDLDSTLSTQLANLSMVGHAVFSVYRRFSTKFIPGQLYNDLQVIPSLI